MMREELIDYLKGLSDRKYQESCWVNKQCPKGVENDEFDYAIHFLFDDTQLSEYPENYIGDFLNSDEEATAVKKLCDHLDSIFETYGTELSDSEYISLKEWSEIIDLSQSAYKIFTNNLR